MLIPFNYVFTKTSYTSRIADVLLDTDMETVLVLLELIKRNADCIPFVIILGDMVSLQLLRLNNLIIIEN